MQTKALKSEWIPAKNASKKLMIVMHGRGDSPAGFHWMPDAIGDASLNYLLLRAPDDYYTGFSWYDLPPDQGPGIVRSRALLDQLMTEVLGQGFQPEDTILFGFSQGCLMTLEWGGRSSRRFGGYIGISGYCYDPEALAREMSAEAKACPWLITHGTFDEVLDFNVTESQVKFLQKAGLPLRFERYRKAHTIDEREELPAIREFIAKIYETPKQL